MHDNQCELLSGCFHCECESRQQPTLCIGGPKDGERIIASGRNFSCVEAPQYRYGDNTVPQFTTHTYRMVVVGAVRLFVHNTLTDHQAVERLTKRYRKTYKKKRLKW